MMFHSLIGSDRRLQTNKNEFIFEENEMFIAIKRARKDKER